MNKWTIVIAMVVLLALCGVIGYQLYLRGEAQAAVSDKEFAIKEGEDITAIHFSHPKGARLMLDSKEGAWVVNGLFYAMPEKVEVMLLTLRNLQVNYPVWGATIDYVKKDISERGIRVEVYTGGKTPERVFYIGSDQKDEKGTFMVMEVNGKPADQYYVVQLPGLKGGISSRFYFDPEEWRDTKMFSFSPEEIVSVSIDYTQDTASSFTLKREVSGYVLKDGKGKQVQQPLFEQGIKKYLFGFEKLNAEGFANKIQNRDSILTSVPYLRLNVKTDDGKEYGTTVYYMPVNQRTKNPFDAAGKPIPFDPDRYYAYDAQTKDLLLIQHFVFSKIFRKRGDFLAEKKPINQE